MKLFISREFAKKYPEVNLVMVEVRGVVVDKSEVLKTEDYKYKDSFAGQKLIQAFQKFYKDVKLARNPKPHHQTLYSSQAVFRICFRFRTLMRQVFSPYHTEPSFGLLS